jgi:hypothetical protein
MGSSGLQAVAGVHALFVGPLNSLCGFLDSGLPDADLVFGLSVADEVRADPPVVVLQGRPDVKGTCVALLSPTCTGPLGRVKSSPLYLLSRRQRERPLLSPMTCTPDLEYLGSSVGTTRIDDASKSRDVDATCDHLTCDLLLL